MRGIYVYNFLCICLILLFFVFAFVVWIGSCFFLHISFHLFQFSFMKFHENHRREMKLCTIYRINICDMIHSKHRGAHQTKKKIKRREEKNKEEHVNAWNNSQCDCRLYRCRNVFNIKMKKRRRRRRRRSIWINFQLSTNTNTTKRRKNKLQTHTFTLHSKAIVCRLITYSIHPMYLNK